MVLRQPLPSSAESYAADRRLEIQAAVAAAQRQWRRMGSEFDASYDLIEPNLLRIADTAQARVAALGSAYIPAVLAETGQARAVAPRFEVDVASLVGTAGDGLPTEGLLYGAVTHARTRVGMGDTVPSALSSSSSWLSAAMGTLLSDTGRASERMQTMARPVAGYVRMLNPPSCGRCVPLAGKWQRSSVTFRRHPRCFPAGVVVSGPESEAATRRWYEGELVVLSTASGQNLSLTGNHPVLTSRGWVPANLIEEGDEVVRSTRPEGATPLVVPDHHQVPARIEDVWGALSVAGLDSVESSPEDFHGDGQHGKVDVVWANGTLDGRVQAALLEQGEQGDLTHASRSALAFAQERGAEPLDLRYAAHPSGLVGGFDLSLPAGLSHLARPDQASLAHASSARASVAQNALDGPARDAVLLGQSVLAGTVEVLPHDGLVGQIKAPRWDAPDGPLTAESRSGYTTRGADLLERLTGQVERDRVVEVRRVEWSGHVYSLTSAEGWHVANSLIVSNCDCATIPASESVAGDLLVDGRAYFDSLDEAGQIRLMGSKANAEAVRDFGGDINQILNAYRGGGGVQSAQVYGRTVKYTTEGTTRRGRAHAAMSQAGYVRAAGEAKAGRYVRLRAPRLMPESIAQIATGKADQERLLRLYGWLG